VKPPVVSFKRSTFHPSRGTSAQQWHTEWQSHDFVSPPTDRQWQKYWHYGRHPRENVLGSGGKREAPLTEQGATSNGWVEWPGFNSGLWDWNLSHVHCKPTGSDGHSWSCIGCSTNECTWTGSRGLTVGTTTIPVHYYQSSNPCRSSTRSFLP
jgi:hypothetical protein